MEPAIFLDRDGVIIENRDNYVRSWGDVEVFPQALSALAVLAATPYRIVLVTNQSIIGRGLVSAEMVTAINQQLIDEIERWGGRIDAVFLCPHAPEENCSCRKPKPGLLLQAAQALSIDLSQSYLIGDALTDLQAGWAAGLKGVALVRTGRGQQQSLALEAQKLPPFPVYDTLADALQDLIAL